MKIKKTKNISLFAAVILLTTSLSATADEVCAGMSPAPGKFVGLVSCSHGSIANLSVRGLVVTNGTTIEGTSDIAGPLTAKASFFKDTLLIASNTLTLEDTSATNITIKPTSTTQSLYLKNGSSVSGTVKFEGSNGVVFVSDDSKISDSQVIGGKVIRLKTQLVKQ